MPVSGPGRLTAVLATSVAMLLSPAVAEAARYAGPPEAYSSYQPQKGCVERAKPGTRKLARWINRRFDGGRARATVRPCDVGGASEHKDGRAIDWSMNAANAADRVEVDRFLRRLFKTNKGGHEHALARRMGVMYIIWNDHMYASYRKFADEDYRSSSCAGTPLRKCSKTLRHRDHVHISLSRPGGRGLTSWYQPPPDPEPEPSPTPVRTK